MHKYLKTVSGVAAVLALGVAMGTAAAQYARAQQAGAAAAPGQPAQKQKAVKDAGEYDIYNEVIKDTNPMNAKKLLTDLDTWTQKYPTTDFKEERTYYYLQAYAGTNQPAKVLEVSKELMTDGLDTLKKDLGSINTGWVLQTLFLTSRNAAILAATGQPTPDQLDQGTKAAHMLADYGKEYFVAANKPATLTDANWAQGLKQVEDEANGTLLQLALYPGNALYNKNPNDPAACAAAEAEYKKTLQEFPDSGLVALQLANVSLKQQTANPDKAQQALYEYARAVALPATPPLGLDAANQKQIEAYLQKIYVGFHGSDEGLAQLKDLAAKTPLPPDGFKIKTKAEVALEKQQEFQAKNPQLAMWMGIKAKLSAPEGQQYFDGQLKDADVKGESGRALKGVVVEGKPACHSKEILMAIPLPDQEGAPVAEVTLKLDAPLTGAVEAGESLQWDGVPTAFTADPLMLTMDTDKPRSTASPSNPAESRRRCTRA